MKIQKSRIILLMILLTILATLPSVYAKTSIEIKPNSSIVYTNKTISEFFDDSMSMKNVGEGLEGSNVDVHMATNKDWAVVSYFSNSAYGTEGEGQNTGITISLDGKEYFSTNGNVTGVMDFGKTITVTAGLISNYQSLEDTSSTDEPYDYGKSIIANAANDNYVNLIEEGNVVRKSMAITGWYNTKEHIRDWLDTPYSAREGIFGFSGGLGLTGAESGAAKSNVTFRPVLWN